VTGTITSQDCGATKFHSLLETSLGQSVVYENKAVGGAKTADVPGSQLATVTTGQPGHVLVILTIGGNDLSPYIFQSDAAAQQGYLQMMPGILQNWEQIFAFFADRTKFPDGATIIMAKQYDPFDDCTASPYNLSAVKIDLLHQFNGSLASLAASHDNVYIADQFTPFLGHGHHYAVNTCPYYKPNSEYWMVDTIHPNNAGHANMAMVWSQAGDHLYKTCQP
jgi:lysophospholipase L1-like esterase